MGGSLYRCANSADVRSQRAGNAAAAAQLLQAHGLAQHVAEVWGLRRRPGGPLRLPRMAARANPLLAVLVSRFQEGAQLLHALGELSPVSHAGLGVSGSVLGSVPLDLCSSLCMTLPQSTPQVQATRPGHKAALTTALLAALAAEATTLACCWAAPRCSQC